MEGWFGDGPSYQGEDEAPSSIIDNSPLKTALGDDMEVMIDGTLFKALYRMSSRDYKVASFTPVEGYPKPLSIYKIIRREEAEEFAKANFMSGYSVDTAALKMGIERLQTQIPYEIRKLREGELVQQELEEIEGFGSF